jgi:hypothetical protein
MNGQSAKNNFNPPLRLGIRLRLKPTLMRLKIRRLLRSFLPITQLRNVNKNRSDDYTIINPDEKLECQGSMATGNSTAILSNSIAPEGKRLATVSIQGHSSSIIDEGNR